MHLLALPLSPSSSGNSKTRKTFSKISKPSSHNAQTTRRGSRVGFKDALLRLFASRLLREEGRGGAARSYDTDGPLPPRPSGSGATLCSQVRPLGSRSPLLLQGATRGSMASPHTEKERVLADSCVSGTRLTCASRNDLCFDLLP